MARRLDLEDLFAIPLASDPRISPDGTTVAFVVTTAERDADDHRSRVWMVPADGEGEPRPFTGGTSDSAPRWSPDGSRLAFLSAREDKPPQLHVIPVEGGEAERITDFPGGVSDPSWSPDGSRIAFLGIVDLEGEPEDDAERERRAHAPRVIRRLDYRADGLGLLGSKRRHLFVLDVDGGEVRQLTEGDALVGGPVWSPDGTRLAFGAAMGKDRDVSVSAEVYVIPASGGEPEEVARGMFVPAVWAPDGESILVAGRPDGAGHGHVQLHRVGLGGGTTTRLWEAFDRNVMLGAPAYPGAIPAFTEDGSQILFCARDRGCVHVYRGDAGGTGVPEKVIGGPARVVAGFTLAGDRLAFVAGLPDSPGEFFVAAADGSDERRLTSLMRDALPDVELSAFEERTVPRRDGVELQAWVIRGESEGPAPVLLDVHGGPHNSWYPAFDGVHLWHQVLAARGWTIVCPNPRGSDGYGEAFYTAVLGGWGLSDEGDFLDVLDALVDEGAADPDRMAVTGYSYGGFMTNWLLARTDRFRCGVSGAGVSNLLTLLTLSDGAYPASILEFGGRPWEIVESLFEQSPLSYVKGITAPMLILHAEGDLNVHIEQAEELFAALRMQGTPVELVRYPGGSHELVLSGRPSHRLDYCERVVDWVTRHTGPNREEHS